ncbi:MAG: 5'/3'-nucleotidase SurE [Anaerolineae bacterium]|nr:5'/3'-nucleotidase SurE [Anaerolineae bacterium]
MHILVSNDDGIHAPGLRALTEAMLPLGKVTVIAPETNQSATGHKKTLDSPLRIRPVQDYREGVNAFAVNGSPSDCTAVAMLGFIKEQIDLVVSGVNMGPNLAQDVTYSGTVAVALEAAIFGLPAVAFSLDDRALDADYSPCIPVARELARATGEHKLPPMTILNVNIPGTPIRGWRVTRQGVREYRDQLVERDDPHGRPYYWIGGERPAGDVKTEGTDLWAVHQGYVSVTPIQLDLTAHTMIDALHKWNINF